MRIGSQIRESLISKSRTACRCRCCFGGGRGERGGSRWSKCWRWKVGSSDSQNSRGEIDDTTKRKLNRQINSRRQVHYVVKGIHFLSHGRRRGMFPRPDSRNPVSKEMPHEFGCCFRQMLFSPVTVPYQNTPFSGPEVLMSEQIHGTDAIALTSIREGRINCS
jgi:hypothetical protein